MKKCFVASTNRKAMDSLRKQVTVALPIRDNRAYVTYL